MRTQYAKDLDRLYESEVLGELTFSIAEALTLSRPKREKWKVLRALEATTKGKLLALVAASGERVQCRAIVRLQAVLAGIGLAIFPWRLSMSLIEMSTGPFLRVFERLERGANTETSDFFTFVVQHELAIVEFAQRERSGSSETSLARASALLGARNAVTSSA